MKVTSSASVKARLPQPPSGSVRHVRQVGQLEQPEGTACLHRPLSLQPDKRQGVAPDRLAFVLRPLLGLAVIGAVFAALPFRIGDTYTDEKGATALRALFATGLFKDVRLEVDGDVLVVIVDERPAIATVDLNGVKEFDKDAVKKSLREVGLAEARIFDRSLLDRAEQELKRQYLGLGRYGAQVTTTVTPVERNRVNITIDVVEGKASKIRHFNIVGNDSFPAHLAVHHQLGRARPQHARQELPVDGRLGPHDHGLHAWELLGLGGVDR